MKHKLKAIMLAMISAIFVFGVNANANTISIVSDTAYAPFEFKDSDQVYKGIDVDIINEVANREGWDINMTFPGFDAAVNAVQAGQADALMAGTTVTEARKKSSRSQILITIQLLLSTLVVMLKCLTINNCQVKLLVLKTELLHKHSLKKIRRNMAIKSKHLILVT